MTHPTALTIDLDKLEELAPCPFCGGSCQLTHGFTTQGNWPDGDFSRVFCTVCQARQLFHKDDAAATAAWNRRASLAAPAATAEPKVPDDKPETVAALENAAQAILDRALGHYRLSNFTLQEECLQCVELVRDVKNKIAYSNN